MDIALVIIASLCALAALGTGIFVIRKLSSQQAAPQGPTPEMIQLMERLTQTQQQLENMRTSVQGSMERNTDLVQKALHQTNESVTQRLDAARQAFSAFQTQVGQMQEATRSLTDLQDAFRNPKLRGNIGEQILHQLIEQVLPRGAYEMQYHFRTGDIVDAIIKQKDTIIPIDSKFPLENFLKLQKATTDDDRELYRREFTKDVKKHIQSIAKKYILPAEGTVDFAVMYVPSEIVYYTVVLESQELIDFATQNRVHLVSPNSFYYFLKIVLLGLRGAQMEQISRQVIQMMGMLETETRKFGDEVGKLDTHLTHAKSSMDRVNAGFGKLTGRLEQIQALERSETTTLPEVPIEPIATPDVDTLITPRVDA